VTIEVALVVGGIELELERLRLELEDENEDDGLEVEPLLLLDEVEEVEVVRPGRTTKTLTTRTASTTTAATPTYLPFKSKNQALRRRFKV
jgi:hypothetical protein